MPTGSWLLYWFAINPWSDESMTVSIRKSFMWTANKEVNVEANMEAIFAAMITTSAVVKIRPEEIQACTGFETRRHFLYKYVSFIWYSKYRSKVNRKGKINTFRSVPRQGLQRTASILIYILDVFLNNNEWHIFCHASVNLKIWSHAVNICGRIIHLSDMP